MPPGWISAGLSFQRVGGRHLQGAWGGYKYYEGPDCQSPDGSQLRMHSWGGHAAGTTGRTLVSMAKAASEVWISIGRLQVATLGGWMITGGCKHKLVSVLPFQKAGWCEGAGGGGGGGDREIN